MNTTDYVFSRFSTSTCNVEEVIGRRGINYWLQETSGWYDVFGNYHETPGFLLSDGYSVPELLWAVARGLKSRKPAYEHDYRYLDGSMSRARADSNLRRGIIATQSGGYVAWKVWLGVRIGGWKAYNHYTHLRNQFGYEYVMNAHMALSLEEAQRKAIVGL